VAETWVVGPSGYAELGCDDDACCPDAGRPLSDLESTVVGAHMVFAGESVAPDRRALRLRGTAPPRSRRSAGRAAAAARAEYRGLREDPGPGAPDALHAWIERLLRSWRQLWRAAERGLPLPAPALGRVLAALEVPVARDAVLTSLTAAWREDGRPVPGGNPPAAVELSVRPPDPTLLRPACAVIEAVVAHAPRARRALPLAVLAFLSWWEGDGSRANVLLEQSLECGEPEGLALLLARVLADGRPPPWVCEVGGAPQSN
jgi:hypothetical protein